MRRREETISTAETRRRGEKAFLTGLLRVFAPPWRIVSAALVCLLATGIGAAETNGFLRQTIPLPSTVRGTRFVDVNADGRADLLAIDPVAQQLLIYRQRASGFPNTPDQTLALPPQTAWVALCNVDAHPGLELLISTASGLEYHRQDAGVFASESRQLVAAEQVWSGDAPPNLLSLETNSALPVVSASQALLYRRNDAFEWTPDPPVDLAAKSGSMTAEPVYHWTLGSHSPRTLFVNQAFRPTNQVVKTEFENDAIKKFVTDLNKAADRRHPAGTSQLDIDGDGRKDRVVWQVVGDLDPRTDLYLFFRGRDGRLPAQPTQVLHCRGIPIAEVGSVHGALTPFGDLDGDGKCELILFEMKTSVTSVDSLLEMALSRGFEWAVTIRSFNGESFSRPAPPVFVTTMVSVEQLRQWPFFICGDFNGDGRPDLVVQRSATQWNIFFSTTDGRWFASQPGLTFEAPLPGFFEIADLNGDGRADIVLRAWDDPRMVIFLTQLRQTKGGSR